MKVALVGPVYPYRGGIAHYTAMLYRALRRERSHEVLMVSFKRQYPRWLFPGRSDKDPSKEPLLVKDAQYWIDSLNPVSWLTTSWRICHYQPDILILQWWTTFWMPCFSVLVYLHRRVFPKSPVAVFCHNVVPHESRHWDYLLSKMFLSLPTHCFVHTKQDKERLLELVPHARVTVVEFPPYQNVVPKRYTRDEARDLLGLDRGIPVVLFFGFVRPYKGLMYLIQAVHQVRHRIPVHLLIVGEFWEDKRKYLQQIQELGLAPYVTIIDRYVRNEEIGVYFEAANVLVLPYLQTSQSAVLRIAFEVGLPVIASDVGGLRESIRDGVDGLLVKPGDSASLVRTILQYLQEGLEPMMRRHMLERHRMASGENIIAQIESLVQERG